MHSEISLGGIKLGTALNRRALVYSLWDGVFANGMLALTETFAVAAAVALKSPIMVIALLGSLPLLLSSVLQLFLPFLVDSSKGRKRYVLRGVFLQIVFLFFAACAGLLPRPFDTWAFLAAFVIYGCSGNSVSGFWIAWMGDLVPPDVRGRHFAWRNRLFALIQLSCALTAGVIARKYTSGNTPWIFFGCVFFTASFLRFCSFLFLTRQYEFAASTPAKPAGFTFNFTGQFLTFLIGSALLQGATSFAGPFFNVWFLRDLHFNYLTLSIASSSTVLGSIVALPLWGKLADSIGHRRVLQLSASLVSLIPLPYLLFDSAPIIWLLNFYSGMAWSGYNLSNFNYLLALSGRDKPEQAISFSIAMTGLVVFIFSLAGGWLAPHAPSLFGWQLRTVFLLSSLFRITIVLLFFRMLTLYEAKPDMHILTAFNNVAGYRAGMGILRNTFRAFRRQ